MAASALSKKCRLTFWNHINRPTTTTCLQKAGSGMNFFGTEVILFLHKRTRDSHAHQTRNETDGN